MAETPPPEPPRTATHAQLIDASAAAVKTVTGLSSPQIIHLILVSLVVVFGFQIYSEKEERREERRERQDAEAGRMREANSQSELMRNHCENNVNRILATFVAESDRNRTHQTTENEKFRREVLATIKHPNGGP